MLFGSCKGSHTKSVINKPSAEASAFALTPSFSRHWTGELSEKLENKASYLFEKDIFLI